MQIRSAALFLRPLLIALTAVLPTAGQQAQAQVAINNLQVTPPAGDYLINSDGDNPNTNTSRWRIRLQADFTFPPGESYRVRFGLLGDSLFGSPAYSGSVTRDHSLAIVPINETLSRNLVPGAADRLDPYVDYRGQIAVFENGNPFTPLKIQEEPAGNARRYLHFPSTDSDDPEVNVITEITDIDFTRKTVVDTDPDAGTFELEVDYTLHRYDRFLAASRNAANIPVRVEVDLIDETDGSVVGSTVLDRSEAMFEWVDTAGARNPRVRSFSRTLEITPDVQLFSASRTYSARAKISHEELPGSASFVEGNTVSTGAQRLLHFDGTLEFGNVVATIEDMGGDASPGAVAGNRIDVLFAVEAGGGSIGDNHSFGPDSFLGRLRDDGAAEVSFGDTVLSGPAADSGVVADVSFERSGGITASPAGLVAAELRVALPAGFGYSNEAGERRLNSRLDFNNVALGQDFLPAVASLTATAGPYFFHEETKPLIFEASDITWLVSGGRFQFSPSSTTPVRRGVLDALAAKSNLLDNPDKEHKRSNDAYFDAVVSTSGSITIEAHPTGGARMSAQLGLDTRDFTSHFPYGVDLSPVAAGSITVVDDEIVPGSFIRVAPFVVRYQTACPDPGGDCPTSGSLPPDELTFSQVGGTVLHFTADGGLVAAGDVTSPHPLRWGYVAQSDQHVHALETELDGNFLMSGAFLRGGGDPLGAEDAPGILHHTGFTPGAPGNAERPGTPAYEAGLADYAGINFRVGFDNGATVLSHFAGSDFGPYALKGISKYYARYSGVSGLHDDSSSPPSATWYGYPFSLSAFGLAYLSNQSVAALSLVEGSISLPSPSNFKVEFERLSFDCLGGIESLEPPAGVPVKTLEYWSSDFATLALDFATDKCDPTAPASLVIGMRTEIPIIDREVVGNIGIAPDGEIVDQTEGVMYAGGLLDSRFALPTHIGLPGPQILRDPQDREIYSLETSEDAYLNNHALAEGDPPYWNFAGAVDVPFFNDLQAHVQIATVAPAVHLMGGWPDQGFSEDGQNFFTAELFDTANRGRPADATLQQYRSGEGGPLDYRVIAKRNWAGLVDLDYPLDWSPALRSFSGRATIPFEAAGVSVGHQCDYLSGQRAELSFGAQLDVDLPRVSLSNIAFDELGVAQGVADSIVSALQDVYNSSGVGSAVQRTLVRGVDDLADLLSDRSELLLAELLDSLVDPAIDALAAEIVAIADQQDDAQMRVADLSSEIAERLIGATGESVADLIRGVNGASEDLVEPLAADIDARLARAQASIDALIGQVTIDPDTGLSLGISADGLLNPGSSNDYVVLRAFTEALVDDFVAPLADAFAGAALSQALAAAQPTLDQLTAVLTGIRAEIGELRSLLASSAEFRMQLEAALQAAGGEVTAAITAAANDIESFVLGIDSRGGDLAEFAAAELKARIRQIVRDHVLGTSLIADVQVAIKERLFDLDARFQAAVDSAFGALNKMIRDLASQALAGISEEFGDLPSFAGLVGTASINGYAHINHDSLRELRLDTDVQWKVPDAMRFAGFLRIRELLSDGPGGCGLGRGERATEIILGAENVPLDWIQPDVRANVDTRFALDSDNDLIGIGGSFKMVNSQLEFEAFTIDQLDAAANFAVSGDATEAYLSAGVGMQFGDYGVDGGIFLGRTCSLAPIGAWDPDVAELLGDPNPTFTGGYAYGQGRVPIFGSGCVFRVSAEIGAGAFFFAEGPTYGGKLFAGVSGEALCLVSVRGDVTMTGVKSGEDFRYNGRGRISGKAGRCPFCVRFRKNVDFKYSGGSWDVDY